MESSKENITPLNVVFLNLLDATGAQTTILPGDELSFGDDGSLALYRDGRQLFFRNGSDDTNGNGRLHFGRKVNHETLMSIVGMLSAILGYQIAGAIVEEGSRRFRVVKEK